MRNLKKILALVLALVMSFSLMATANAFTDSEKITDTYETAVTVLDGLKVFQGYEDGSFRPQDAIKRSEVAAIIYRIVTGDVAGTQVGIYADYNKFTDVKSTSWYAGYVNFCANAEYIKGRDAKTFDPDAYVTGYEALAMILRAIGYDKNGEFTGSNWQVQTAATGEQRGITKNISEGTLGTYATREVVAEILFQTILVDKVNYTPAFGYQLDDTSLGWDTFELEEITGVVVANEYADLYSSKPAKAGETELNVDGDIYTLSYSTTLEDIGEARDAYITKGENVLYIADAGNTVFETGAATDIEKDKDFEKATGLERDDATEDFINFDDGSDDIYEADILINYSVKGDASDRVTIKAGEKLTADEYSDIKDIFTDDDYADGWVVVGTKYDVASAADKDISNDITFRNFVKDYLVSTSKDTIEVTESDNGEWLKVIDNDGDGVADYVFLTEFAMSVINRISKDGEYTLADLATREDAVRFDDKTVIDGDEIVTEDELAEDDVVIYTLIDGNYYMSIAEMVTETIDAGKNAINSKTETITCDGTDYVQSHIGYTDKSVYEYDVTEAETETTYDLYLDHFGYVRLFVESDYNVFMLLTDGWYEDDNRTETFQAYYWDVEAGEETQIDVVDNNDASDFIADYNWTGYWGDQETWGRLLGADVTYRLNAYNRPNTYASNIAGYSETADGYALKKVQDSTSREDYMVQAFEVDKNVSLKETYLEASDPRENDIQTTSNTQYYLVIRDNDTRTVSGWDVDDVITWTGYKNAPDGAKLNFEDGNVVVGYAVTHVTKSGSGSYNVADVVVFETKASTDQDTYFVYARNNSRIEHVWGIGYDDEGAIADQRLNAERGIGDMIRFYEIDDDAVADEIGTAVDPKGDYADHYIYNGFATTDWDIEGVDYVQVDTLYNGKMNVELDAPIFKLTRNSDGTYDVKEMDRDDVHYMDAVIVFTDDDENVEYAIWVGTTVNYLSVPGQYVVTGEYQALVDLWYDIADDAAPAIPAPTAAAEAIAKLAQYDTEAEITAANYEAAKTAVAAAKALKPSDAKDDDEWYALQDAIAEVEVAIAAYKEASNTQALADAKTAAKKALSDFINTYAGEDADIVNADAAVQKLVAAINSIIDFQNTPEAASAIFGYDADREGEKYWGASYDKTDSAWTAVIGVSATGNLKRDVMAAVDTVNVAAVEGARTASKNLMDQELTTSYVSTDYTSDEWAILTAVVEDYKAQMDAALTVAAVNALKTSCRQALAEAAVQIAAERIGTTYVCNTVNGMNNESSALENALTALVTDDVTLSLEPGTKNANQAIYTVTITSAHVSTVSTEIENFVAALKA